MLYMNACLCSSYQGGTLSNGAVSLKQAGNTRSTASLATSSVTSLTQRIDFVALSFAHFCNGKYSRTNLCDIVHYSTYTNTQYRHGLHRYILHVNRYWEYTGDTEIQVNWAPDNTYTLT